MSEETTRNFWEVMRSFQWSEPQPISFRLYYDEVGRPIVYTMETLPGSYIEVDQTTYIRASDQVRVRDGKLIVLEPKKHASKVAWNQDSGTPCDPKDVCVVVDLDRPHKKWKLITNDIN